MIVSLFLARISLFNQKTLVKNIPVVDQVPDAHAAILENWSQLITSKRIEAYSEVELHAEFKKHIVGAVLGYRGAADTTDAQEYTVASEKAVLKGSVDLALGHFSPTRSDIIAPFELKGAKTKDLDAIMSGRAKSPVQQAWEYATNARGVKWVLVSNYVEIRLYGFGEGTQAYEIFKLDQLTDINQYSKFVALLSAENLLGGRTLDLLEESRKEEKRITDDLYADYKTIRGSLIFAIGQEIGEQDPVLPISIAQKILDRVLFTAFAEDTGLLPHKILERAYQHADPFNPRACVG